MVIEKGKTKTMDLSIMQKVNELVEQGRSTDDIRHELQASGIAPETVTQALTEAGTNQTNQQPVQEAPTPLMPHHEKVIQPTPGFDPNAK
jgi:EAL domain-containing protein (putative c-di-GMP-specific phosphodiesterase class I)